MTLDILKTQNQQLWFTICLRLGKIYLDQSNIKELDEMLSILKNSCKVQKDGDQIMQSSSRDREDYDPAKSNLLLETFALEIQMCD